MRLPRYHQALGLLFGSLSLVVDPGSARGDGGTVRLSEKKAGYRITVFTSPTPLRAGPVDISVLVQDAATEEPLPGARVTVRTAPRGRLDEAVVYPATTEAATNKLFHAAVFELPRAGWWEMEVRVAGKRGTGRVHLEVQAGAALPRWVTMWPWIGWPVVVILLFGVHQYLVRRRSAAAACGLARPR